MLFRDKNKQMQLWLIGLLVCGSAAAQQTNSYPSLQSVSLPSGKLHVHLGLFDAYQGNTQDIAIQGIIGDRFTVTNHNSQNALAGLGYYLDGLNTPLFKLSYGLDAFWLGNTLVKGNVTQEDTFFNLSYNYHVTHYPIYLATQAIVKTKSNRYSLIIDLGIGPNFIQTSDFQENSRDGITVPDVIFSGNTKTTLSATAGIGIKLSSQIQPGTIPLECGYRFFYLGKGNFSKLNNQVINTLNTGNNYANAVVCSVTLG